METYLETFFDEKNRYRIEGLAKGLRDESKPPQYIRDKPKIGRNTQCSCGSGKKYKKCCI
tara:strand:+ start:842 stop:1021 length:180 start_codon:yes stop_codon:yes gene_type:complete